MQNIVAFHAPAFCLSCGLPLIVEGWDAEAVLAGTDAHTSRCPVCHSEIRVEYKYG